jgi:hypothetical protein
LEGVRARREYEPSEDQASKVSRMNKAFKDPVKVVARARPSKSLSHC